MSEAGGRSRVHATGVGVPLSDRIVTGRLADAHGGEQLVRS
jgi:hypothetical protein